MATSAGQKWLIGCAIGCGAILLVGAMLAAGTCYVVKDFVKEIEEVEASHEDLVAAFGRHDEFTPAADGSVASDRVRTFLAVRAELAESRERMHELLDEFPPEEGAGIWMFFKVVGGLAGLIDDVVTFIDSRNDALLEHGMGYGEYLYIYSVAYYSWLGHDPADGPTHDGERIFDGDDSTFGVDQSYRNYRRFMLAVLRNQLDALPADTDEAWRLRLLGEIDALDRDRRHVAWRDDLPPALEAALAPFRAELEATYDEETNCFELPTNERDSQGHFRLRVD